MTFSRYMQQLMRTDPELFANKLRATDNADEILKASRNYVNEALMHPRNDSIEQFARGEVQLRVGESDYTAQVVVAARPSGELMLYDIINLESTNINENRRTDSDYTAIPHNEVGSRQSESASTNSISEAGEDVNLTPTEISAQNKKSNAAIAKNSSPRTDRSTASGFSTSIISEAGEDVNAKFSRSAESIRYSIDPGFASDIDAWSRAGRPAGESFVLGSTGEVLQGLGTIESDIYMLGDKISTIMNEHSEITLDEIKRIPEVLDDPVLILKSQNVGREGLANTRLLIFGSVKAQNGQPMLTVLDLRPSENGFRINDMQKVSSAYTKKFGAKEFFGNSEVMYADKKRTAPLLRASGFSSTVTLLRSGSIGSISYTGQNVNLKGEKFSDVVRVGEAEDTKFSLSSGENLTDAAGEDIITDEERGAILQYKSSESYKINQALRDGIALTPEMQRIVDCLDSALPKLPKVGGTLYRTLTFDDATDAEDALNAFLAEHKTGFPVRYLAYTSTSITPDGHPLADDVKYGVVMEIEGKTARSLEGFGNNFENEALYPRNARFDVLSVERVADGIYHIKAREVVNDAGESKGRMGLHPEERDGTVREVSETHRTHNDLRGVSGVDTGRGDGQEGRLSGLRAEGVEEKFSLSQNKRVGEVEFLRELNDYLREQMKMTSRPRMTRPRR